jgi:hypothetical protein
MWLGAWMNYENGVFSMSASGVEIVNCAVLIGSGGRRNSGRVAMPIEVDRIE